MKMIDTLQQFIAKYYIDPILTDSGYNPVNTITWAIILGLSIFWVLKVLSRINVKIDDGFILAIIPYIIFGSSLRVIEDAGAIQPPFSYLLITPIIYGVIFAITISLMMLTRYAAPKFNVRDWRVLFGAIGAVLVIANFAVLLGVEDIVRPGIFLFIVGAGTGLALIIYLISQRIGFSLVTNKLNFAIMWAHILDASSTYAGVDVIGTYHEKHVVPAYLIELTGTALVIYPLKLAIFFPVLWILDTEFKDDDALRNLVKLTILVLGFAPATRNTIRMVFGI